MSDTVFANGMSIACKASSGKSAAAMPDVCLSPPSPPAGPLPIPYPNTAMASDADKGSKTVQIAGQEVMLKDRSVFKKSSGNEAATKSFGMNVVTHQIQGEANFLAWSMDVKFEGENVPRHMDIMGHNEACPPTATPPWPFMASMANAKDDPCAKDKEKEEKACANHDEDNSPCPEHNPPAPVPEGSAGYGNYLAARQIYYTALGDDIAGNPCLRARRCKLVKKKGGVKDDACCPGQTPHHLIEGASFDGVPEIGKYSYNAAPCICVEGPDQGTGTHGLMHTFQSVLTAKKMKNKTQSFQQASNTAAKSVTKVFKESDCEESCIRAQLSQYHGSDEVGVKATTRIKAVETGGTSEASVQNAEAKLSARAARLNSLGQTTSLAE